MKYIVDYESHGKLEKIDQFVLMSQSPRRKELLSSFNPSLDHVDVDERSIQSYYEEKYREDDFYHRYGKIGCEIAKAKSGHKEEDHTLYISSDTMVLHNQQVYNKPDGDQEAYNMLRSYLGKTHVVITAVCMRNKDFLEAFYSFARVKFARESQRTLSGIDKYVKSAKTKDKAGAYGIQELPAYMIEYIEGDINTIIGFPLTAFTIKLDQAFHL